jgi:hypothetical protein
MYGTLRANAIAGSDLFKAGGPQRIGDAQLCTLTRRLQLISRLYLAIFVVVFVCAAGFFTGLWA